MKANSSDSNGLEYVWAIYLAQKKTKNRHFQVERNVKHRHGHLYTHAGEYQFLEFYNDPKTKIFWFSPSEVIIEITALS